MRKRQVSAAWRDSALETGGFVDFSFDSLPRYKTQCLPYIAVFFLFLVVTFAVQVHAKLHQVRSSLSSFRNFDEDDICKLSTQVTYVPYVYFRQDRVYMRPRIKECGGQMLVVDEVCASGRTVQARRCKSIYVEHLDQKTFYKTIHSLVEGSDVICLQHWIDVMDKRIC